MSTTLTQNQINALSEYVVGFGSEGGSITPGLHILLSQAEVDKIGGQRQEAN
jgi:hypothetical protein